MLLPSDVARLVLGYLQEEGLAATSQAFILESPNLKEYVEHTTGDGTIPACVFSIFGKGLTTILNEYVAARTKDSCPKVPAVMSSLWKKLDFTLNQIKSLQNSPSISACQRTRSRIGVANMSRQRVLTVASAGSTVCSSVSETSSIISPAHTAHSVLSHSTPVSYTAPHSRLAPGMHQQINDGSRLIGDSPVHIVVSENRLNPGPMSPGRRKWDTPRKRSGALGGSSGPGRSAITVNSLGAEPQPEEAVDENFPQLVIQNARDKILGDRSLQEKLAENINKILANEPTPQTSKASTTTVETDQSIDEILGLQGEIHMSDDAIHDILEQTESDPAFQALFDLFDYNKSKFADGEQGDGDVSGSPEDSDAAGSSSSLRPLQCDDQGTVHEDTSVSDTTTLEAKTRAGQDRKTRKSPAPTLFKKTLLAPSGRASRIEGSSARLLVSRGEPLAVSSSAGGSNRKERTSFFSNSVGVTPMDIDEPVNTLPPPLDSMATSDRTSTSAGLCESTKVASSGVSAVFAPSVASSSSNVDKKCNHKQTTQEQPNTAPSFVFTNQPVLASPGQVEPNSSATPTADPSDMPVSSGVGETEPVFSQSIPAESASCTTASPSVTVAAMHPSSSACNPAPFTATTGSPKCTFTSASFSSSVPVTAVPNPSSVNLGAPSKAATDSNNIVSLKIIISENHEEDSPNDTALNQAISSISGDKIPTIYLSSPAKSPGTLLCPGTPKASLDEVAQAVSGLQNSEAHASPLGNKVGALMTSSLTGSPQGQQSYIIQLPVDTSNPALPGTNASYLLVTEPPTTDTQTRQVLVPAGVSKGQPLPKKQFDGTTPTCSQGYPAGPALILPSTVKPMMLPVLGQNTQGNVQVVSNQLVTIPNPVSIQQSETVKSSPSTVMIKQFTTAGTEENVIQPLSAENTSQQDAAKGPNHRRILCFDSSGGVQPQPPTTHNTTASATTTSTSQPVQKPKKDDTTTAPRTKPAILGGNKPKRRVEITRCSVDPQTAGGLMKDAEKSIPPQYLHKNPVKKNPRKQHHNIYNQESQSTCKNEVLSSQPETSKKLESGKRSKSVDRKQTCDIIDTKANDCHIPKSLTSNSAPKSETKNEKEENCRKEEKDPAKTREGRTEKRPLSEEIPNVTANKENEIKGSMQEQQQSTSTSSASRDFSPSAVPQSKSSSQCTATKAPSKTSSLVKQAAEMLQDIQGLKKPGAGSSDLSLSRTPIAGCNQEPSTESPRTPSQKKNVKDGEGTPIRLMPPNTPEVPSCSPASETGSENSINMAAHTLMILSRAAIARTGTPLKDSLRQDGVGEKSPTSSKNSKKRKQSPPIDSLPTKESKRSPSRKKERKRLVNCFPHDLDVDKFLSSLHYDE